MAAQPPPIPARKTSGLAITSLVLGIISMVCCSVLTGIPAIICGHVARGKIKREPLLQGGGLALAGLILGYLSIVFLPIFSALTIPVINGAVARGQMTQALSNAKQIHLAMEQMALDAKASGDKSLGYPADAGIRTVGELKERLVSGGYLTEGDIESLEFDKFLFGNVSQGDAADTIVIRLKPEAFPNGAIVFMKLSGEGQLLMKRQLEQMTAQDPPREPVYLSEE